MRMSDLEITIIADENDGDYITAVTIISKEGLDRLRPIAEKIKSFKPYKSKGRTHTHNWTIGECLRDDLGEKPPEEIYGLSEEDMEFFEEFLPCPQHGFHTIERIEVCPKQNKERLV